VCRCIELHKRLGRMDHFLEYYRANRRLQLNSDLVPPASFLDSYQNFIAQVPLSPCCRPCSGGRPPPAPVALCCCGTSAAGRGKAAGLLVTAVPGRPRERRERGGARERERERDNIIR
jgi:hypothetical protein